MSLVLDLKKVVSAGLNNKYGKTYGMGFATICRPPGDPKVDMIESVCRRTIGLDGNVL